MREFREWGHRLIDWVADYLESPERYPVLSRVRPNEIIDSLPAGGPERGEPMEKIFAQMAEKAESLCERYVAPRIIRPISEAIASRS